MIKLFTDSRDLKYNEHFGQVVFFPDEFNVDTPLFDDVQPIGDVKCVAYTCTDIASDQTGVKYDIPDLFNRIPNDVNGANPRDGFSEVCKNGLLPVGQTERVKKWKTYFSAHTGSYDAFDNVRSALQIANSPIAVYTRWYSNWNVGQGGILRVGEIAMNGHCYDIQGWKMINGEPMLVVQAWQGYTSYMPRNVFNKALSVWGCGTAVLSTEEIEHRKVKSIIMTVIDALKNLLSFFQEREIVAEPVKVVEIPKEVEKTKGQKLYDKAMSLKGQYLTLDKTVPKDLNCCQCMSYIFKSMGLILPFKGISGTIVMDKWLSQNMTKIKESELTVGDVVIAVTQGQEHGHIWINGKEAMLSNNSDNGLLTSHWTLKGALQTYRVEKKLSVNFYRLK